MIGFGGAPIGLVEDEGVARATIESAWELGVRVFDTAPLYGLGVSERRIGSLLRTKPRDDFTISTKVGRLLRADGAEPGIARDYSAGGVRRSLEESLTRLGLDRVDVVLVHDPDDFYEEARATAIPELIRMREEGIVRAVGAGMNQTQMLERFVRELDIDCLLVAGRYSLLDRSADVTLLPLCAERGVKVILGGVFNSGILAGGSTYDYAPASADVVARAEVLRTVCALHGVPLKAAAIQFALRHPAVTTVLVGAASPAEVEENLGLTEPELPEELWSELT